MKQMDFQPRGTCSKLIHIELTDDDRVSDVSFVGGCPGNLKGISALIKGMHKDDVISRLCGIKCGNSMGHLLVVNSFASLSKSLSKPSLHDISIVGKRSSKYRTK